MEEDKKKGILSSIKERYNKEVLKRIKEKSEREYYKKLTELQKDKSNVIDNKVKNSLRDSIFKKNKRKFNLAFARVAISAVFGTLAIVGGVQATQALNEGSGRVEGVTQEKDSLKNTSKEQAFRDKYKVVESLDEMIDAFELQDSITKEVEALEEDKNAVLNYIKEPFVERYNNINNENKTVEDVSFWRTHNNVAYTDVAANGENIIRICGKEYAKEHGLKVYPSTGEVITIRIDNKVVEVIVGVEDHFVQAYLENEEVIEPREGIADDIGNLLNAGIGYSVTLSDDKARENQSVYRRRLVDEMVKYKELQSKQVVREQNDNQKQDNGFEIGE